MRRGRASRVVMQVVLPALLLGGITPAGAEGQPGSTLRVSVLTFGPGGAVWERFGHNAIRIRDVATGFDLSYNWGTFSFDEPNFIPRFLAGDTEYWVDTVPTQWLVQHYRRVDRHTIEQDLALTPAQRAELAAFVTVNMRPENQRYRYDYFRDNCSTRVRDALDRVLGGALERRFTTVNTTFTYRSETVRLLTPDPLPQAGTDFALGPRADRPLTAWEAMFVPMRLRDFLREVTVVGPDGTPIPLVSEERVLHDATRMPEPAEARGIALGTWGPLLGAWMLLLIPVSEKVRRRLRIPAVVLASLWYLATGLLGLVLLGMWLGSAHVFWYWNLNLLVVSPLALVACVPVAVALVRGRMAPWVRWLVIAIAAQAVLALLLAPFVPQRLGGPLLLVLPAQVALAIAVLRHMRLAAGATATAAPTTAVTPAPAP